MGGEGLTWVGLAPFTSQTHAFQNLGDGTYFHSGLLAIRAAVAANVNITYKLLYNDAVAMTGGQPVEGHLSVAEITRQLRAERVATIAVVADDPAKYGRAAGFAPGVTLHERHELDAVQRRLREVPGVTALIYDQVCAAEKRRRRKRGRLADPDRRVLINPLVCEGCGDCSARSNCVSVLPLETEFGRKRAIDQSSCNKDYSCIEGFCRPSSRSRAPSCASPSPRASTPARSPRCPSRSPSRPTVRSACSSPASAARASSPSAPCSPWPRTSRGARRASTT
jgi:indolepyruvate ferredoxin oxidoreductase